MSKNIQKHTNRKSYDAIRALLVKKLANQYKVTDPTIRSAINGFGKGPYADKIRKKKKKEYKQLTEILSG